MRAVTFTNLATVQLKLICLFITGLRNSDCTLAVAETTAGTGQWPWRRCRRAAPPASSFAQTDRGTVVAPDREDIPVAAAAAVGDNSSSCRTAAEADGCKVAAVVVVDKAAVEGGSTAAEADQHIVEVGPERIVVAVLELDLQAVV